MSAERQRQHMVETQIARRGIRDPQLLAAFGTVPRERFVLPHQERHAYADQALPIGHGQTISQPYMVAVMLDITHPGPGDRVLEVGTGLGYQAALLAELGAEVVTIERIGALARAARLRLHDAGYERVEVIHGDGHAGFPDRAPFDVILVAAGAGEIPPALRQQLADGGRLAMPVGDALMMEVVLVERDGDKLHETRREPCLFVPLQHGTVEE